MSDRRGLAVRVLGALSVCCAVAEVGLLWRFLLRITPDRLLAALVGGSVYLVLIRVRWLLIDGGK